MNHNWNGNLFKATNSGESLTVIIADVLMIPSALAATAAACFAAWSASAVWYMYIVALVAGPIFGLVIAILVAMSICIGIGILYLAHLPFKLGYERFQ